MFDVVFHYFLDVEIIVFLWLDGFFQLRGLKNPTDVVIEWNAFISVELKDEPSPKWYTGNDPPHLFSLTSYPIARTEEKNMCFLGGECSFCVIFWT